MARAGRRPASSTACLEFDSLPNYHVVSQRPCLPVPLLPDLGTQRNIRDRARTDKGSFALLDRRSLCRCRLFSCALPRDEPLFTPNFIVAHLAQLVLLHAWLIVLSRAGLCSPCNGYVAAGMLSNHSASLTWNVQATAASYGGPSALLAPVLVIALTSSTHYPPATPFFPLSW
eukprot:scaffold277549_cov36-Tisochrysis_lutea.AAC.2